MYSDSTQQTIDELEDFLSQNTNPASEALAKKVAEAKRQLLAAKENYFRPVLLNIPKEYRYNQYDYHKFDNGKNRNNGCSITALSTVVSYLLDQKIEPATGKTKDDSPTFGWGENGLNSWLPGTQSKTYPFSLEGNQDVYKQIIGELNDGIPVILKVNHHYVTVVGVNFDNTENGFSRNNFTIIDPYEGKQIPLDKYKYDPTGIQIVTFNSSNVSSYGNSRGGN